MPAAARRVVSRLTRPGVPLLAAAGAMLVLVYAASLVLWIAVAGLPAARPWDPYVTVVTEREPTEAAALLLAAGAQDVITPRTSEVFVTRFSHVDRLPVDAALQQLDPLDPRRDPFLTSLMDYFRLPDPDGRAVLYARFDSTPLSARRAARRVLGGDARVGELEIVRLVASVVLFAAFCAVLVVGTRRHRVSVLLGVLPWLPVAASAGLPVVATLVPVMFAWTWALRDLVRWRETRARGAPSLRELAAAIWCGTAAFASLAMVWRFSGTGTLAPWAFAAAGTGSVTAIALFLAGRRSRRGDHRLFAPVSILPARTLFGGPPVRLPSAWLIALAACLLVLPPLADRLLPRSGLAPQPVPVAGVTDFSPPSLELLWRSHEAGRLPDISDYLAHRAYQEALAYGREYGFPTPGERVTISRFSVNDDGTYSRYGEDILVFDDAWFADALHSAPAGIVRLLASPERPSGVVLSPTAGLYSDYPLWQHTAYVILALLPALVGGHRLLPLRLRRSRVAEIAGRRRQVA